MQNTLTTAAEAAIAGRGPRLVMIEGEAGMGKSYIGAWLRERLEENGQMRTLVIREPQAQQGGGLRAALLRPLGAPLPITTSRQVFLETFDDETTRELAMRVYGRSQTMHGALISPSVRRQS